ncbi:DUF2867 domain-containing protein [Marivita hallyeonensis]|uniref:DUF2867 domain-containing protein n=1 Tax=Marivita hallyeonensis TaxID=996342 RepID=A0A1M5XTT1_9RHOB|nr:DUF2867 domain-containing protein [Marivita hallyeonensis]SHI02928.1 Protein of unknown function [Marivita hallyeonensis]
MSDGRPDRAADWQDTHAGPVASDYRTARQAFDAGFANMPRWVDGAMSARNAIVRRFGLVTGEEGAGVMTRLPVWRETSDVFETGLVDKHLTFSIETRLSTGHVAATTRIWFNHWAGRLYLGIVMIPHKIIMRHIVRSLA